MLDQPGALAVWRVNDANPQASKIAKDLNRYHLLSGFEGYEGAVWRSLADQSSRL
jgi:hypothetical protein